MKHTSKISRDIFIIGFALFSMFFGAGNIIFPPYLGLESGPRWLLGFFCYFAADIGLALLTLFALLRCGGTKELTGRIGRIPSVVLMSAVILCIGPMVAIPRTAASTYEMSLSPFFSGISPWLFSALFFAVIFLLCVRESAIVDIVGKILTPVLLLGLFILIVKGVADPIGAISEEAQAEHVPATGIKAGYQTMDVLATLVFGILILKSAGERGYGQRQEKWRVVSGAGIVAGVSLFAVYLGLTYLGATASELFDLSVNRTVLVTSIVHRLLGPYGGILFSVVVALACVTTSLALVSSSAEYFSQLSRGRLSYRLLCLIICAFSAVVSIAGLDQIVAVAAPILDVIYPPALVLVLLAFFSRHIKRDLVFRFAALGALLFSLLSTLDAHTGLSFPFLNRLPLSDLGFGWILPSAVAGAVGFFMPSKHKAISNMDI